MVGGTQYQEVVHFRTRIWAQLTFADGFAGLAWTPKVGSLLLQEYHGDVGP